MKKLFLIIITFVLAVTALPAQALVLPRGEEPSSTAQNQNLSLSFPTQEATTQPTPTPQTNNTPTTFSLNFQDDEIVVNPAVLNSWKEQTAIPKQSLIIRPENSLATELNNFFGQTPGAINQNSQNYNYRLDKIYSFIEQTAKTLDVPAIDPELTIENDRATTFVPPQNGQKINIYQSSLNALNALEKNQTSSGLIVDLTPPKTQLSQFNNMGITELIAHGVSAFAGSPKNRRHNIAVGVEKFKGIIVKQGEEFSFNKYLGDVDGQHGFLPELVIKATGTVPEFGGGLCQVSSTAFRAAMAAGLPITQRKNHAYAVQYYSPQGTDATIYPGVVDLKFINDTPGAVLIWPYEKDANTLVFDFYGTKDSRQVTLNKPVVYDRRTDGSMKADWTRLIVKDGQTSTSTFHSVYRSPALYHKQEQFVAATPTQTTLLQLPKIN